MIEPDQTQSLQRRLGDVESKRSFALPGFGQRRVEIRALAQ